MFAPKSLKAYSFSLIALPFLTPRLQAAAPRLILDLAPLETPAKINLELENLVPGGTFPQENSLDPNAQPLEKIAGLEFTRMSRKSKSRLQQAVSLAQTTHTGQMIIRKMEKLSHRKGNYPVTFSSLGKNLGQYDYASKTLQLDRKFLHEDLRLSVSTLIHEMTHILQHSQEIPAEALEMELEAYALHIKTLKELNLPVGKWDSFSQNAFKLLKRDPDEYIDWMAEQHPGKFLLRYGNSDELADIQEDELERQGELIAHLDKKNKENPKNPALKRRMKRARTISSWIQRDIALLRSPKDLARYHQFSKRVYSLLRRISHSL